MRLRACFKLNQHVSAEAFGAPCSLVIAIVALRFAVIFLNCFKSSKTFNNLKEQQNKYVSAAGCSLMEKTNNKQT